LPQNFVTSVSWLLAFDSKCQARATWHTFQSLAIVFNAATATDNTNNQPASNNNNQLNLQQQLTRLIKQSGWPSFCWALT